MLDRFNDFFLSEPKRLLSLGVVLARVGGFFMVAGVIGNVATTASAAALGIAKHVQANAALADVFPRCWTWWIPETVVGYASALLLVIAGLLIARVGRTYQRLMGV